MKRSYTTMDVDIPQRVSRAPRTPATTPTLKRRRMSGTSLSAKQAAQVRRIIERNSELKYIAFGVVPTTFSFGMTLLAFPAITQGVTDSERVGDRLNWCGHIDLKIRFLLSLTSTQPSTNFRIMVIQWHPTGVPTAANILIAGPSGGPDPMSQITHDNRQQVTVLFDKLFNCSVNSVGFANDNFESGIRYFKIPLKRAAKQCQFVAGGATATNLFYLLVGHDDGVSATTARPAYSYDLKIVYRDA